MQTSEIKRGKTYTDGKGIRRAVDIYHGWEAMLVAWAGCSGAGRLDAGTTTLKTFARWARSEVSSVKVEVAP